MRAGRVGRPHGLDGAVHVTQPVPALLAAGAELLVGGAPRRILQRGGTDERPVLRLEGCGDRAAAEALRGAELAVPRAAAPPLGPEEWYAEDLVGCRVRDGQTLVGEVAALVALPSCEALQVGERLIPLVRDAVRAVDVERRVIDVDLGFLEP